ncbi:MAG: hypothetical protein KA807_07555 [Prolixibacteraceae bacterium]|nr:hypothetical protein [Prolixibacteraceae bacterium]
MLKLNIFDGKPKFIKTEDFKYNRRYNLTNSKYKKDIYLPIFKNLKELLFDLGYEDNVGKEEYIIDPDSKRNRETMKDDLSKAFSHFWKKTNSQEELEFRHLRKTYITRINNFTGGRADSITGHSGQEVILKYYQDPRVVDTVIQNFSM